MKKKLIVAMLLLGVVALAAFALGAELHLLPESWTELAPYAFIALGVLLLVITWCAWPNLMAWALKSEDRESMK